MGPISGVVKSNGGINITLVEGLMDAISREHLSYFNNGGAVGLGGGNREKLEKIMADAQPNDLFHTLSKSVSLQNLGSGDPNKTYPIRAAQIFIAKRIQKIGLPDNLEQKPDIVWSIGLPEEVVSMLIEQISVN